MIHRASFRNFKALRDVDVTFDSRLTVLVGPNGSGKTSVLSGLDILCHVLTTSPMPGRIFTFPALEDVFSGGPTNDLELDACENVHDGFQRGIHIRANPTSDYGWKVYTQRDADRQEYGLDERRPPEASPTFFPAEFLQLVPSHLAAATLTSQVPPRMDLSGLGLASVLAYLKLYEEERFDEVVTRFKQIVPYVKRVRLDRVAVGEKGLGEGLVFDLSTRAGVRASAMSDGTLYVLGLLTAIASPRRAKVLLIDDIDHGLHPKAQMGLVRLLRAILDDHPDLQVIATSHSPYILDRLEPHEVRVTALQDDGSATVARLEDHPEFEKWKDSMSPGEFWSFAGEQWVGRVPAKVAP
jgi:predicted ATPase